MNLFCSIEYICFLFVGATDNTGVPSSLPGALEDAGAGAGSVREGGSVLDGEVGAMEHQIGECLERMCAEMAGHADTIQSLTSEMMRNVLAQSQHHDAAHNAPALTTHNPPELSAHNAPALSVHNAPALSAHNAPALSTHTAPVVSSLQPPEVLSETLVTEHLVIKSDDEELDRRKSTGDMSHGCGGSHMHRYNHATNINGASPSCSQTGGSTGGVEKLDELQLFQIGNLQLTALKAVTVLLGSSRYLELLLVPKVGLAEKEKDGGNLGGTTLPPVVEPAGNELRESMRSIMKQMVRKAVLPSPMKRTASLLDLERAQTMLYKVALASQAEQRNGLVEKRGMCVVLHHNGIQRYWTHSNLTLLRQNK